MTALTISHLPLAVGGAVASSVGRIGLWAIGRFARAPLAYSGIFVMTTLSVMAASNVMYHQAHRHPSPFFFAHGAEQPAELQEVRPVEAPQRRIPPVQQQPQLSQPQVMPQQIAPETTGSVPDISTDGPVGNAKVYEVQRKLAEMRLFAGKVDGYYGPMTADAIRKFEQQTGREPQGALTQEISNAILASPDGPLSYAQPEPAPLAPPPNQVAEIQPVAQPQPNNIYVAPANAMPQPVTQQAEVPPLVFSQPVPQQVAQQQNQQPVLIARQVESGPEEILDDVATGAAGVFDSVASSVQGAMNQPSPLRQVQAPAEAPRPPANLVADISPAQKMPAPRVPADAQSSTDPVLVAKVQRGLASLGFLAGSVDGVPGEATAKAIRNFEVYYNYEVTGKVTPQLLQMLQDAGAVI